MAAPMVSGGLALALGAGADRRSLAGLITSTAGNVYGNQANDAFRGKLGEQGRLDLAQFLSSALK